MQAAVYPLLRKVRARAGRLLCRDDGSSSVEWVSLTACIATLMVVVAIGLRTQGTSIGVSIGQVIECQIAALGNGGSCSNAVPGLSIAGVISPNVGNVGTAAVGLPLTLNALPISPVVISLLGLVALLAIGGLVIGTVANSMAVVLRTSATQQFPPPTNTPRPAPTATLPPTNTPRPPANTATPSPTAT